MNVHAKLTSVRGSLLVGLVLALALAVAACGGGSSKPKPARAASKTGFHGAVANPPTGGRRSC